MPNEMAVVKVPESSASIVRAASGVYQHLISKGMSFGEISQIGHLLGTFAGADKRQTPLQPLQPTQEVPR